MKKAAGSQANTFTNCLFYLSIGSFLSELYGEFKSPQSPPFLINGCENEKLNQYNEKK
jgi:hypothetical protein